MEDEDRDDYVPVEAKNYYTARLMMSPEIVEIGEDSKSVASSREFGLMCRDVYVAVGKDDLDVLKWALDHVVSSDTTCRVFLIHVFPPITHIPTPGNTLISFFANFLLFFFLTYLCIINNFMLYV